MFPCYVEGYIYRSEVFDYASPLSMMGFIVVNNIQICHIHLYVIKIEKIYVQESLLIKMLILLKIKINQILKHNKCNTFFNWFQTLFLLFFFFVKWIQIQIQTWMQKIDFFFFGWIKIQNDKNPFKTSLSFIFYFFINLIFVFIIGIVQPQVLFELSCEDTHSFS